MCRILPNNLIKHMITILSEDLQLCLDQVHVVICFMMSADVAYNIKINGFLNPRVYKQKSRVTINVGSVMLFMRL